MALTCPELGVQPRAHGVPPDQPPALPGPPEDVGEAQEGEGLGLALTPGTAVLTGEPSELDDPGLVRVHLQRERFQPLLQLGQEPVASAERRRQRCTQRSQT